jgi:hypothetical protein
MNGFIRGCGFALALGGLLFIVINAFLTPFLPTQEGEAAVRTSTIYLIRLSASGVAAMLLLFGCIGVHLAHRGASGVLGRVAFILAFVGTSLLVAVEWSNVFVLRPVAQASPETLEAVGESALMNSGFALAMGLFSLGWLLLTLSILRAGWVARWVPLTMLVGLFAIPVLGATPLGMIGAIVGNVILGAGLIGLGNGLTRVE